MPRKKKTEEVAVVPETLTIIEPKVEVPKEEIVKVFEPINPDLVLKVAEIPKEPETVKIRVKTGTLSFELGTFEHGSIITVPKERVARFDPNSIEVIA